MGPIWTPPAGSEGSSREKYEGDHSHEVFFRIDLSRSREPYNIVERCCTALTAMGCYVLHALQEQNAGLTLASLLSLAARSPSFPQWRIKLRTVETYVKILAWIGLELSIARKQAEIFINTKGLSETLEAKARLKFRCEELKSNKKSL